MNEQAFPLFDTSMSALDTWSRCDRRFHYRYGRGLVPKGASDNMLWGTLFHRAAQDYYRSLKAHGTQQTALHNAHHAIENVTVVENRYHGDSNITLTREQRQAMHDAFNYYYENIASKDEWDEIVSVEDPLFLIVGYNGSPVMRIRSTLDLLARKKGKLVVVDHKTTGDVEQNLAFLGLDFQVREYALAVRSYYEEDADVCYNMISRDVPPGFGSNPLTTKTGRLRSAETLASMQRQEKYLRREWLTYSETQYNAMQMNLVQIALQIHFAGASNIWPRRVIKMGGMACDTCPYFEICKAELDGRVISDDSAVVTMAFTRDPMLENTKKIVIPGTPGNPFVR